MTQLPQLVRNRRIVALTEVVTLAGFLGFILLPDPQRAGGAVMMALGSLATLGCVAARTRQAPGQLQTWALLATLGLSGATAYLHSLEDSNAIPVVGVALLFVSFVGLIVTSAMLFSTDAPRRQHR